MITIIYVHPCQESFNRAILNEIVSKLEQTNQSYTVLDLYKDEFNPVLSEKEFTLYYQGKYIDPLVGSYQAVLKNSEKVIFIFPIWWGTTPAILKGFLDKVFLVNFSHTYENGWTPLLNIDNTFIITTSQNSSDAFTSSIKNGFIKENLEMVGMKNISWLNCDNVGFGTDEHREQFLEKARGSV